MSEKKKQLTKAETQVMKEALCAFQLKQTALDLALNGQNVRAYYEQMIQLHALENASLLSLPERQDSKEAFSSRIHDLPVDRVPVILIGGSFNNDRHLTRRRSEVCRMLDALLDEGDPQKMVFVIGHTLSGYERYLVEHNRGRYDVFAFVPSKIGAQDRHRLEDAGVSIRVSIEPSPMGVYKSFSYEIFKRRPSVLLALDGNSSAANMIQEAKNGKRKCHIFVFEAVRMLREKARSLEGYATLFSAKDPLASNVLSSVEICYPQAWLRTEDP